VAVKVWAVAYRNWDADEIFGVYSSEEKATERLRSLNAGVRDGQVCVANCIDEIEVDRDVNPETEEPLPGEKNNQASGGGEAMAEAKKPAMTVREAGRLGGRKTWEKYGPEHFERLGARGAARARELVRRGKALEAAENDGG
jgi:hypothetical protein